MRLRYTKRDGTLAELPLSDRPLTIGRNPDSDIVLIDERVSRIHCGLRLWDGEYYLKDLKSRNGTFVNGNRIEVTTLKPGDEVKVGATLLYFEDENAPGPDTAISDLGKEMAKGKGYTTILREIAPDRKPAVAQGGADDEPAAAPVARPLTGAPRKPVRLIIKKRPSAE
jgi:predicted component of type VI protein secretion system